MRVLGFTLVFAISVVSAQVEVPADKTITLNGEWNLVLNQFLTYDQLDEQESVTINVPGSWNGVSWQGANFSGIGFGTYYKKLKLSNSKDDVIIDMPAVGLAYRLYVNNDLIGQVGKPGVEKHTTDPKIKPSAFRIPSKFLNSEITLIVHVSNFSHQNGGMWFSPQIGNAQYHNEMKSKSMALNLLVLGSILIIMVYHFFIFILRPKENYSLYFALVCLCLLVHITTQADIALINLFPSLKWSTIFKLAYSSLIMVAPLNLAFIQKLYPSLVSAKLSKYMMVVGLTCAIISWVIPPALGYYTVPPFQVIILLVGIYIMGVLTIAARRELAGASLLLVGFAFTFLSAIHDILNSQFIIESTSIIHFGVFIYVLTLSMVLAKKFVRFINANERLRFELKILNTDLEKRVEERTAELKSQEELVKVKNSKLENANEELNQLMTILAHDLKSPLLNINSLSEMMKNQLDESLLQSNAMMQKIATDGVSMIDSLISMKRLEKEDFNKAMKVFDLSRLMNIKAAEFESQAEIKNQSLASFIQPDVKIFSSERHLSQILDNLLSNAIKFSPSDASVLLKMERIGKKIHIQITDEGPGFSEMDKKKIFGKFQKLSARPTAGESSSGLGLSIVKMLVDKLGGSIELKSEKDNGATFRISFPYSNL